MTLSELIRHHLSLMHGWLPTTVQAIAAVMLIAAIGWRTRRWRLVWVPWAALVGVTLAVTAYWFVASEGLAGNPAPHALWMWIGLSGFAAGVLVAGWRGARWWRRGVSALTPPLCLLCVALAVNLWVGYLPTVQAAWSQLTAGPLPDQTDPVAVTAMQHHHRIPANGTLVPVKVADTASGFKHRGELVYLPPAWYAADPPPPLPTVMMIGGEFNTPADWVRAGNAVKTVDDFATAHGGSAPVLVFVDAGGAFNNDSECVNGSRGNAADHLTKDVVPYMISHYGVNPSRASWGIVGWSMGGTCAVDLAVMHPDMFSAVRGHRRAAVRSRTSRATSAPMQVPKPRPSTVSSAATPPRTRPSIPPRSSPATVRIPALPAGSTSTSTPMPRTRRRPTRYAR